MKKWRKLKPGDLNYYPGRHGCETSLIAYLIMFLDNHENKYQWSAILNVRELKSTYHGGFNETCIMGSSKDLKTAKRDAEKSGFEILKTYQKWINNQKRILDLELSVQQDDEK